MYVCTLEDTCTQDCYDFQSVLGPLSCLHKRKRTNALRSHNTHTHSKLTYTQLHAQARHTQSARKSHTHKHETLSRATIRDLGYALSVSFPTCPLPNIPKEISTLAF